MLPLLVYTCTGKPVERPLRVLRPCLYSFNFVSGASAQHKCQSLGIEPVTDVPQDRGSHVLPACQQLEKVTGPINGPPPVRDCLPL